MLRASVAVAAALASHCAVPKAAAGEGMLPAIAYGTKLNLAYPPRPMDPLIAWEPEWNVKIRVKSQSTAMLGMESMGGMQEMEGMEETAPDAGGNAARAREQEKKKFSPFDALKEAAKQATP